MQYKITSDLHLNHASMIKWYPKYRNFGDKIEDMNNGIIKHWNDNVKPEDTVYHLGDFAFATEDFIVKILDNLNGKKVFIIGNHDRKVKKVLKEYGSVYTRLNLRFDINKKQTQIVLDHFPLLEWDGLYHGALHFYGHCHGTLTNKGRSIDVCYDKQGKILDLKKAIELAYLNNQEIFKVETLDFIKQYEG